MIKAVIFDLNGVFVSSRYLSDRFKEDFNVSNEEFLPALKEVMGKVRLPDAPGVFELWQPYFDKWKVDLSPEQFADYWFKAEHEVPEMTAIARQLKEQGTKLFILSNNFVERTNYYEENFPFLVDITDKCYFSWQTGFVKPDERAYQLILDENDLKPEECLYFDDSDRNVEIARALGLQAFKFEGAEKLKEVLKKFELD